LRGPRASPRLPPRRPYRCQGEVKKELDAPFAASVLSAFVVNEGEGVVTPVVVGVGVGATGFHEARKPSASRGAHVLVLYCTGIRIYLTIRNI
ncbi:hypothetical protein Ctob_008187, partial [Chrysochromulina tobinii]